MAVSADAALGRRNIVQVSDLDPSAALLFSGSVAGDVSGGLAVITATCPTDLAWFIATVLVEMNGSNTEACKYEIVDGGSTVFRAGGSANSIDTRNAPTLQAPPPLIFTTHPLTVAVTTANVDGDSTFFNVLAFGWDLSVARNLPLKFFWPGTIG